MTDQPTSKELARRTGTYGQATLGERQQYAQALAAAGELLPKTFWTNNGNPRPDGKGGIIQPQPSPGKVLMMTETAAMLGIHPMAGLTQIHIIEGKPTLSAALWTALVREAGHRLRVVVDGEGESLKAIATLVRKDDPDFEFRVEWGIAEMRQAGLANKDNWKKYTRSMLKSRAITEVIREGAPEVGMGAAYTPEELNPNLRVNEAGEPVELQQIPEPSQVGTPTAEPATQAEAPIQGTPPVLGEGSFDWSKAIRDASSRDEVLELFGRAKSGGLLASTIKVGRKSRPLGDVLVEVGKAFAEAEKAEAQRAEDAEAEAIEAELEDEAGDTPAVLDEDIQDAEVESDG